MRFPGLIADDEVNELELSFSQSGIVIPDDSAFTFYANSHKPVASANDSLQVYIYPSGNPRPIAPVASMYLENMYSYFNLYQIPPDVFDDFHGDTVTVEFVCSLNRGNGDFSSVYLDNICISDEPLVDSNINQACASDSFPPGSRTECMKSGSCSNHDPLLFGFNITSYQCGSGIPSDFSIYYEKSLVHYLSPVDGHYHVRINNFDVYCTHPVQTLQTNFNFGAPHAFEKEFDAITLHNSSYFNVCEYCNYDWPEGADDYFSHTSTYYDIQTIFADDYEDFRCPEGSDGYIAFLPIVPEDDTVTVWIFHSDLNPNSDYFDCCPFAVALLNLMWNDDDGNSIPYCRYWCYSPDEYVHGEEASARITHNFTLTKYRPEFNVHSPDPDYTLLWGYTPQRTWCMRRGTWDLGAGILVPEDFFGASRPHGNIAPTVGPFEYQPFGDDYYYDYLAFLVDYENFLAEGLK